MAMVLTTALIFGVKQVASEKTWFEISTIPKDLGYAGVIEDWLQDETSQGSTVVQNAKLLGIHDNENVAEDDPRFNYTFEEPVTEETDGIDFLVVKQEDGQHLAAMLINEPEAYLFREMIRLANQHQMLGRTDWDPQEPWVELGSTKALRDAKEEDEFNRIVHSKAGT